jgi:hypothetical protein
MSNRQKNFEIGYRQGYNGIEYKPELSKYAGYDDGWDAGNCDRPTLEELIPMDRNKEASTGCLS